MQENKSFQPNPLNMGSFVYHMAKNDVENNYITEKISDQLALHVDKFKRRTAFGLLYGAVRSSLEKHIIFFAKKEYESKVRTN